MPKFKHSNMRHFEEFSNNCCRVLRDQTDLHLAKQTQMGLSSLKKGVGERDCNDKWPFMKNSQVVSKQSHDFKKRSSES